MKESKKGISLIVLVITIIVIIILASAIIVTLSNNGILNRANNAVDAYDEAQMKNLAMLAWSEAYLDGAKTDEEYETYIKDYIKEAGVTDEQFEQYAIEANAKGVNLKKGWIQKGTEVYKGTKVITVGDTITYDETDEGKYTTLTATEWKVLGANEDGELLIMSTANIADNYSFGGSLLQAQIDYMGGVKELDELCEPYAQTFGAVGARTMRADDVDKITGYDKTTYKKGTIEEYGNVVRYSAFEAKGDLHAYYDNDNKWQYISTFHNNGFYWYGVEGKQWYTADTSIFAQGDFPYPSMYATEDPSVEAKVTNTFYYYDASALSTFSTSHKAYAMLFGASDTFNYWLGTPYIYTATSKVRFGYLEVERGMMYDTVFVDSDGTYRGPSSGVRAVVELDKEVILSGSSQAGWTYKLDKSLVEEI